MNTAKASAPTPLVMRPFGLADIHPLVANLRPEDLQACNATSPGPIEDKLRLALALGNVFLISLPDGRPIALWSDVPVQARKEVGVIGLLLTKAAEEHVDALVSLLRPTLKGLLRTYHLLTNVVWERNELHLQLLERFGAQFIEHYPKAGPFDEPFFQFVIAEKAVPPTSRSAH